MAEQTRRDLLGLRSGGEGTITGTVVCAAAIAYAGGESESLGRLALAVLGTVTVYWIAHLHAITVGSALTQRRHPLAAVRHGLVETWPILGASALPVGILLLSALLGAEVRTAAWIALAAATALLTGYSYLAGARAGLDVWGRLASAVAGALVGALVVLLKVALH